MSRKFEDVPEDIEAEIILRHYAREYSYEQLLTICSHSTNTPILKEVCRNIWPLKLAYDLGDKDPNKFMVDSLRENRPIYALILLKEYNVDPSTGNNRAIIYASERGYVEIVKFLLEDARVTSNLDGDEIVLAAQVGFLEIIKLLIAAGADPSVKNNFPLTLAHFNKRRDVVKFLLQDYRVSEKLSPVQIKNYSNNYG